MEKYSQVYKKEVRLLVEAESDTKKIIDLQNKIAAVVCFRFENLANKTHSM